MRWDSNSDQPFVEMDPKKKRRARLKQFDEMLKILFTSVVLFPLGFLYGFLKQKLGCSQKNEVNNFFGVGVNLDKYPKESADLIKELGVQTITIRVPLWDVANIEEYKSFAKQFQNQEIIFILMQNRDLVVDEEKLEESVGISFKTLSPISKKFQFGVAINRYKWGYFTTKEYLKNLAVVEKLKNEYDIFLLGSSVIDYEYLLTIRTLFNCYRYKLDALSSLLYVDRRGTPENTQGYLNLIGKIEFLDFLNRLSFKTKSKKIYITETNWPIKDSQPYTPTSNDECVDEDLQGAYLVRYYCLALATGKVEAVYWHQLFSPGFGLIDFREGIRKRESFYALKFMTHTLEGSAFINLKEKDGLYEARFIKDEKSISLFWGEREEIITQDKYKYYRISGEEVVENIITISNSPIYKIEVKA